MDRERVVVTGLGVVSGVGNDHKSFWETITAGRHGFREIELTDVSDLQFKLGAEVRDLDLDAPFEVESRRLLDRFARLFIVAAREAVMDSGLPRSAFAEAAVVTGSSLGGQHTQDDMFRELYREGRRRFGPYGVPRIMANAGASHLSTEMGIEGPGFTLSTACASSNHAVGHAFWLVSRGLVPLAITGGSESPFSRGHLKAWDSLRAVSPELCRPFSRNRKGLVLGEGAGALVLEPLGSARARGAVIHAEVLGFGMSSDAVHVTKPASRGAARALRATLADAGLAPESIDYINAHGTGTPLNDVTEAQAIRDVFGEHAGRLWVSSTKSMHGHGLGASGALEAVATVLALSTGVVPPTANFEEPDPDCDLDVVPNEAREKIIERALSSSFAFGGLNAVLAFGRPLL